MTTAAQLIRELTKPAFSFELLPPLKGNNISRVFNTIDTLKEFNPIYINITSHRDEVVFKNTEKGLFERKVIRKRPGTVAVAASIQHRYGIKVIPHIICSGFTRSETEYALLDLNFLGIHDLLLLRGDNSQKERFVQTSEAGNAYAIDLVRQVSDLNQGKFLDNTIAEPFETPFSFGVAGYPEKHEEAPNLDSDIYWLKQKVDGGAEYVVTQMFFDNSKFFQFVDKCRAQGINVPIVPGLKPISTFKHLEMLPRTFSIDIPHELVKEIRSCKNNKEINQVGIEWCVAQSKELIAYGVPAVHYYTMGKSENIQEIVKQVF